MLKKNIILLLTLFIGCLPIYKTFKGDVKSTEDDVRKSQTIKQQAKEKLDEGNIKTSIELIRNAYELNPSDTALYINLAKTLAKSRTASNCLESLLMINDLIEKDPNNRTLYLTKIEILKYCDFRILTALGVSDQAYEDLLAIDSTNQDALFYLATREYQFWLNNKTFKSQQARSGDAFEAALKYFRKLAEYYPDFVPGIHGLSQLYQDSYLSYYIPDLVNRAVIDYPNSPELWLDLAAFYYTEARGRIYYLKKSKESFDRAFAIMDSTHLLDYAQIGFYLKGKDLTDYENAPDKIKAAKKFWIKSTLFYLHGYNEYELEHYTRVWYAKNHFFVPLRNRDGDKTDRGNFYIRYGKPDDVVSVKGSNKRYDDSLTVTNFGEETAEDFGKSLSGDWGETRDDLRSKDNFERWFYGNYELKFIYNRNFSDYIFEEPYDKTYDLTSKGNYISPKIFKRPIAIASKTFIDRIDSSRVRLITYFAIPINSKTKIQKEFAIKLEEGKYLFDTDYNLVSSSQRNLPVFNPESIVDDARDSVFAVQKTSVVIENGDYHYSHEVWMKNTDQLFSTRTDLSIQKPKPNSLSIENMNLIYRNLTELTKYDDLSLPNYYHFLPIFDSKIKKGRKVKLFIRINNASKEQGHDYLVEWEMTKISSGFISGIVDALTFGSSSTSVEFNYQNKPSVFHDNWDIDTKEYATGTYRIVLEVVDKKTKSRDRKELIFEIVN